MVPTSSTELSFATGMARSCIEGRGGSDSPCPEFLGQTVLVFRARVPCTGECMYECYSASGFTTSIPTLNLMYQEPQKTVFLYLDLVREVCPTPRTCPTLVRYSNFYPEMYLMYRVGLLTV